MSRLWSLLAAGAAFAYLPVALLVLLLLGPQQTSCVTGGDSSPAAGQAPSVIVGDSLTVGAEQMFRQRYPQATIRALGGMPWSWGVNQLRAMAPTSGSLVVFLMGTNGGVSAAQVEALLRSFPNVSFVLMTVSIPLAYTTSTNTVINAAAAQHHDRIQVADWHARITAQPNLLGPDHIHPASSAGVNAFVDTVAQALGPSQSGQLVANVRSTGSHPPPWTQAEMEAAVARYDPQQAHVLGAIAMAETGGSQFPTTNPTGEYHGPWAFQVASNAPRGVDMHRLDTDLNYAAQQAAILASTGITHGKWETWPAMAARFLHGPVSLTGQMQTSSACLDAAAVGSGSIVSAAGLTFPLQTTQAAILRGGLTTTGTYERWCYTSLTNCHHDYNAADIMAPTGTVVVAPVSGTIVNAHRGLGDACVYDNRGDNFSLKQDGNGMAWFMGHLLTGSLRPQVGDHVTAGQPIGLVGRASEAQCTVSHLHIQLNPPGQYGNQQDPLNVQPALVSLFHKLP